MHTAVATTQPEFRNRWQRFRQRQREGRRVYPLDLDEELVLGARGAEEREVPLVERAHRRYEADVPGFGELGAQLRDAPERLHVASASVAPASVS